MKKIFYFVLPTAVIIVLLSVILMQRNLLNSIQTRPAPTPSEQQSPTPTSTSTPKPATDQDSSGVPAGWSTYSNNQYGFEISYPSDYEALDDAENLYGWPNAIVLIYGGGQSYDLPIEVWDTASQYQTKYPNTENLTVKQIGDKYITLLNANYSSEVDEIIETFSLTQ